MLSTSSPSEPSAAWWEGRDRALPPGNDLLATLDRGRGVRVKPVQSQALRRKGTRRGRLGARSLGCHHNAAGNFAPHAGRSVARLQIPISCHRFRMPKGADERSACWTNRTALER